MAPISNLLPRDGGLSANSGVAFYLLIVLTVLFAVGCTSMVALWALRKVRRNRQGSAKSHCRGRHAHSIAIINEKSAFLDEEVRSPSTDSVPEIRITFPEEQTADGKRQSRVVIVKIGEKGSVGYEPYQEPLPVYKEKENPRFQSLDLERIGGLKEKDIKA